MARARAPARADRYDNNKYARVCVCYVHDDNNLVIICLGPSPTPLTGYVRAYAYIYNIIITTRARHVTSPSRHRHVDDGYITIW